MVNIAIIPARGGSKGIPRKNVRMLAGKPLVVWTIEAALRAESVDMVVVSSDDEEIKELAVKHGALAHNRPEILAEDNVHAIHVIIDCLRFYERKGIIIDEVAMLLPTSPLRDEADIDEAFGTLGGYATSVVGVCKSNKPESNFRHINSDGILHPIKDVDKYEVQRQDIADPIYEVNGAMFVAMRSHLDSFSSFHEGNPVAYIMSKTRSVDINDSEDFNIAEAILCRK